jgi:tetratricopeptide (TPR) repeat protein
VFSDPGASRTLSTPSQRLLRSLASDEASDLESTEAAELLARLYNTRGSLARRRGDEERALRDYDAGIEVAQRLKESTQPLLALHTNRGVALASMGEHQRAVADFGIALDCLVAIGEPHDAAEVVRLASIRVARAASLLACQEPEQASSDLDAASAFLDRPIVAGDSRAGELRELAVSLRARLPARPF